MNGVQEKNTLIRVPRELAAKVKTAKIDNAKVSLFPTKNGYEYFVIRTPQVKRV